MPFFRSLVETAIRRRRPCVNLVSVRLPSSVTTRVSSMRTPPMPGEVDARLDGDDDAGGEDSSALLADRRGLVDVEADAVPGAVLEALGPAGLARSRRRHTVSTSFAPTPARTAATPWAWESRTTSNTRGQLAGRLAAEPERPGHVGAVALEGGAEVDHHRLARREHGRRSAGGGAWPSWARPPRSCRTRGPRPRPAASRCRAPSANSDSVTVVVAISASIGRTSAQRGVGDGGGPGHAVELAGVLHLAQRLDRPGHRHALGRALEQLPPAPLTRPTSRRRPRGRPAPAPAALEGRADRGRAGPRPSPIAMSSSSATPAAATCSADWVAVAAVGGEQRALRGRRPPRRPSR